MSRAHAMNPEEKEPLGLYDKYTVLKDGKPVEGFTFTLRPQDPHALIALSAYAQSVRPFNPQLADDLMRVVRRFDEFDIVSEYRLVGTDVEYHAVEHAMCQLFPIEVTNEEGQPIAYVDRYVDSGSPQTHDHPGEPGYVGYFFVSPAAAAEQRKARNG